MSYVIDTEASANPRSVNLREETIIRFVASSTSGEPTPSGVTYGTSGPIYFVRPEGKVQQFSKPVKIGVQTEVRQPVEFDSDSPPASGVYSVDIRVDDAQGRPGSAFTSATITIL